MALCWMQPSSASSNDSLGSLQPASLLHYRQIFINQKTMDFSDKQLFNMLIF